MFSLYLLGMRLLVYTTINEIDKISESFEMNLILFYVCSVQLLQVYWIRLRSTFQYYCDRENTIDEYMERTNSSILPHDDAKLEETNCFE